MLGENIAPVRTGWELDDEVCGATCAEADRSLLCQLIWNMGAKSIAAVILADVSGTTAVLESSTAPRSQRTVGIAAEVAVWMHVWPP